MRFFTKILKPKSFIYGVGMAKTGTTSLIAILRSGMPMVIHKGEFLKNLNQIREANVQILRGEGGETEIHKLLLARRKMAQKGGYRADCKPLFIDVIKPLFSLFPNSKYVLTVREPYAWLNSIVNHERNKLKNTLYREYRPLRWGGYEFAPEETILRENGLYTLNGYLSYWANRNREVLNTVPSNKLLVVRTDRFNSSLDAMALFCGVKVGGLLLEYKNKSGGKALSIRELDRDFVEAKVQEHCGELMRELFPDIRSSADSPVYQTPI